MIVIVSQAGGIHILNLEQSMNENEEEEDIAFFSKFWQSAPFDFHGWPGFARRKELPGGARGMTVVS